MPLAQNTAVGGIIGGGAFGGVTAALMDGKVRRITVLDANREHVARMRDPGLELDELGSTRTVRLDAHAPADEIDGSFDLGPATLKAPRTSAAVSRRRST
jgi:2-dehydropantoate 2-reductase